MRLPCETDFAAYMAFYGDAAASAFYGGPLSENRVFARLAADIGHWHLRGFGVWSLVDRDTGSTLGTTGFWQGPEWPVELTWWLLPKARGRGLAQEASRVAIAHAYDSFGWDKVQTYMDDANDPARKLVLSLGGTKARRLTFPDGKLRDLIDLPNPALAETEV